MKRVSILMVLLALALLLVPHASATVYNLTDMNSSMKVDDSSQAGAYNWITDGVNALYQQWFWYRVGSEPDAPINNLPLISSAATHSNEVTINYGSRSGLEIEVDYVLHGGTTNSRTADVAEVISLFNHGSTALNVHFFQYSDFDLNRWTLADNVVIDPSRRFVTQTPVANGPIMSETVLTPAPNRVEANYYANTLGHLNSGTPYDLNNVYTAGPGDVTWAFQWDMTLAPGGSFLISKDKNLRSVVPEPATLGLLGGVLIVLARKYRRHMV